MSATLRFIRTTLGLAFPGWYRILRCNGSDYALRYNILCEIERGSHADPAGEADSGALRLDFDRRVMLRFHGSAITSDGGLLAYRELDDVPQAAARDWRRHAPAGTDATCWSDCCGSRYSAG
jgi:hypothetical protein